MQKSKKNEKYFAFNAPNLDALLILADISKARGSSFVTQVSVKLLNFYGHEILNSALKGKKKMARFSLDHCNDLSIISKCRANDGWFSALFDGSSFDLKNNISLSQKALKICSKNGILLECEVSGVKKGLNSEIMDIEKFISQVDCDLIGLSIGTGHGEKVGSKVNLDIVKEIRKITDKQIVIHGGSGIDNATIRKLFDLGANKINISTALKQIYSDSAGPSYDILNTNKKLHSAFLNFIEEKERLLK